MSVEGVLDIEPIATVGRSCEEGNHGTVVFESKYRDPDALRGIETFSHLWLIYGTPEDELALCIVTLEGIEKTKGKGHVLKVGKLSLPDKTPVFDIKPYLPPVDCHLC